MAIAITADVHLKTTYEAAPERYDALQNILEQVQKAAIPVLILAGDTYDTAVSNPALLDELLKSYPTVQVYMIPGNHDSTLQPAAFTAPNLTLVTSPAWHHLGASGLPCLFLPYQAGRSMGAALADVQAEQGLPEPNQPWLLVGHGDYLSSQKPANPYEPGIYMPLTSRDLRQYQPAQVLLGHIHNRHEQQNVHYPGSPCGLDITETGKRYFSVLYPETMQREAVKVRTAVIYLNETLMVIPVPHEAAYVQQQLTAMKNRWALDADEWARAILRLRVRGYTRDRKQLKALLEEALPGIRWEAGSPDLTAVATQTDPRKADLVQQMQEKVANEADTLQQLGVSPEAVMEKALHQILES